MGSNVVNFPTFFFLPTAFAFSVVEMAGMMALGLTKIATVAVLVTLPLAIIAAIKMTWDVAKAAPANVSAAAHTMIKLCKDIYSSLIDVMKPLIKESQTSTYSSSPLVTGYNLLKNVSKVCGIPVSPEMIPLNPLQKPSFLLNKPS